MMNGAHTIINPAKRLFVSNSPRGISKMPTARNTVANKSAPTVNDQAIALEEGESLEAVVRNPPNSTPAVSTKNFVCPSSRLYAACHPQYAIPKNRPAKRK